MKKILSFLVYLVLGLFILAALYVFDVWPFNPGGPLIKENRQETQIVTQQQLPSFIQDNKIGRTQSYDEHMNRGKMLEEKGYLSLAISEFDAASRQSPATSEPLIQIGRMHIKNNDYLKAKLSFEQAISLEPSNLTAQTYLVRCDLALRKPEDAKKVLDGITTHNKISKYYQGIVSIYFGEYENGKNMLKDAIDLPGSDEYSIKAKNYLAAFDEFNSNQGGQQAHLKTLIARSFVQTGEYQLAIPLLFSVINDKKDYRDAWIILGYAYLNTEKYAEAIEALEEAKKLDPQEPDTLFFLGLGYYGVNDLNKAVGYLENARKNGYEPRIQIDQKLAEIYLQLKQYQKAALSYEEVIALNHDDVNYFIRPMWIYLERLNQATSATTLAQKALATHPGDAMSYNLVGWAKIGEGKFDEAAIYLNQALKIDPKLSAVYLNFGALNEKKNNTADAINYYKKAFLLGNGSSISGAAADKYNQLIARLNQPQPQADMKASILKQ
jgi:tetratricopeptide (TPR) repeat protein